MKNLIHIGDNIDTEQDIENIFKVSLLPLDIFDFWERCGQFSDFIADYFTYNFTDRPGCKNLISTVINELVENSVKYSKNKSQPIELVIRKRAHRLVITITNSVPRHQKEKFSSICKELFERDLDELYVERVQAASLDSKYSGLGLILLKKDYNAQLGFNFFENDQDLSYVTISLDIEVG
jgi:hypothetical protein